MVDTLKRMRKTLMVIFFAGFVLGITACQGPGIHQAYSGAPRAASDVSTFTIPGEFNLLYIDGERYKSSFIQDGAVLQLLPGEHQFIIEYQDYWEITTNEFERVESQPLSVSFTTIASNKFILDYEKLLTIEDAKVYAKEPIFGIKNLSTLAVVSSDIKYRLKDKAYLSNFVKSGFSKDGSATTDQPQQVDILEKLKYWWGEAESRQQESFRQWIESQ